MNAYETITARIIASLESGVVPWRKEWKASAAGTAFPHNKLTGKSYRGINVLSLLCSPYQSSAWLTYKQAQELGAQVRKGEKGSPVVFWKFDRKGAKDDGGEAVVVDDRKDRSAPFMRTYTVFNVEQVDGLQDALPFEAPEFNAIESAQSIVDAYLAGASHPTLAHGGDRACYSPARDHVQMPNAGCFTTAEAYYCTLFHEFAHSTGHDSRLKRKIDNHFGTADYSDEELVAEFSAAFLSAESHISSDELLDNSAAYIHGWLDKLRNDSKIAIYAAQRAQKAADFILGRFASSTEVAA